MHSLPIPLILESKIASVEKLLGNIQHPFMEIAKRLVLASDYASRQVELLKQLLSCEEKIEILKRNEYFHEIKQISLLQSQQNYMRELRIYRNKHFVRLLLLQEAKIAKIDEIMESWSDCADAIILHTIAFCQSTMASNYGLPFDFSGSPVQFFTLAMGKLGGRELNFSSDIDLIFAYDAIGETNGANPTSNQQYFDKLAQIFVSILQPITAEGFVFRVDLRLRPNGDSGPLVSSLAALETYYQEQGRDWERYAMAKARVISEVLEQKPIWFNNLILPFVYRRYVDFSVIESLRSMKALIEREVQLNPRLDDIKRGRGGIREIEFIIQSTQLIRGGRLPQLQVQGTIRALIVIKHEQLIPHTDAIQQAYLFLRQLENALQALNDQQTHALPVDPSKQAQIVLSMGFMNWEQLIEKLTQYQRIVSNLFRSILGKVEAYEDEKRLLSNQLSSLWQGHIEETMAINLLMSLGFTQARECYQVVNTFRHSPRCRRLSQASRMRLDRLMVLLLSKLSHFPNTHDALVKIMHLLENIVGRSAYLSLLTENPQTLDELLFWFSNSSFFTSLLVSQPFLLEVLLDQEISWRLPAKGELARELSLQLEHYGDTESQQDVLRQFKLTYWFRAARAEVYGRINALRAGKFLADLAEIIVNTVVAMACKQLEVRYPEIHTIKANFAIVAYGKLGSREMNYTSDLDLVFLYTASNHVEDLVTRLTQKILHMLTTRTQTGVLYTVDTRLRPSGSAGLLVSPLSAFVEYQQKQAWTWEHQALIKARMILGNANIKKKFKQLKASVLSKLRNTQELQHEVLAMRSKIEEFKEKPTMNGLLDLEFLVQFLVLDMGRPELAKYSNTMNLLQQLFMLKRLSQEQYQNLKRAYRHFHRILHLNILKSINTQGDKEIQEVMAICNQIYLKADHTSSKSII